MTMQEGEPLPGTENIGGGEKQTYLDASKGELSDGSSLEDLGYPEQDAEAQPTGKAARDSGQGKDD